VIPAGLPLAVAIHDGGRAERSERGGQGVERRPARDGQNGAVGATCTVTVGFKPPNTGIYSGQLTVQSNAGTLTSALTGSGKPIHN
jgi:hypothetical protein